jgi:hypothetical protein
MTPHSTSLMKLGVVPLFWREIVNPPTAFDAARIPMIGAAVASPPAGIIGAKDIV